MLTRVLSLHDEAGAEYDAAFDWYLERSLDAARKFDAEVNRAFGEIAQSPLRWTHGLHHTRRFLLRKFPFVLVYRERTPGEVEVLALAHTSRKPGYWKERV